MTINQEVIGAVYKSSTHEPSANFKSLGDIFESAGSSVQLHCIVTLWRWTVA